jgi:hypothetical protein
MSFIFGVNLCDRIYLSGDTRLTAKNAKGEIEGFKDDLIKVEPLSADVMLAAANSASMAAFLIRKMLKSDLKKMNIREVRENIQQILAPMVDEYWTTYDSKGAVTFIFGGIDRANKKKFDPKKIHEKIMTFTKADKSQSAMSLRPALFNAMVEKRYEEPSDSHIFSIQIYPPNEFIITDAEWGEYLAYGPKGINKDALPDETFGKLEFAQGNDPVGHDNMIIAALTKMIAEEKRAETIGGGVFVGIVCDQMTAAVGGTVYTFDPKTNKTALVSHIFGVAGSFYRKDERGTNHRLTHLKDYKDFGSLEI